ncbi:hypothetical protein CAPTEDRAFT_191278 [Capitella teleta]|uniref:C-type lectin domain-containing protein n=1 Tax=Capitella teleta TaxID=283909 RepID=R7UF04_CAPTE|nr:hypothetical protein CAPTEDRAFT_191278 [Capitella teleta]|eukprot:ELU01857.1 hypothetical protein CAPTEDRAFT_191278 [Capitella teleta]
MRVSLTTALLLFTLTEAQKIKCNKRANGYCYLLRTDSQQSWTEAQNSCFSFGGVLASVRNEATEDVLLQILQENNINYGSVWVGGKMENPLELTGDPEGRWRWLPDPSTEDEIVPTACGADFPTLRRKLDEPAPIDLTILVDGSGSLEAYFTEVKTFVKNVTDLFTIGENDTRVSVVLFGNSAEVQFYLNDHYTKEDVHNAIDNIQHREENTNICAALNVLRKDVLTLEKGDRPSVPNMVIVFSDGVSTLKKDKTIPEAVKAQDEGNSLFVVGVTSAIDLDEIVGMTSPPKQQDFNYWLLPTFDDLQAKSFLHKLRNSICYFQRRKLILDLHTLQNQGCYNDLGSYRDLRDEVTLSGDVTPPNCIAACRNAGYTFAGVQTPDSCYCGFEFGVHGIADRCTTKCTDDDDYVCGGPNKMVVYRADASCNPTQRQNGEFIELSDGCLFVSTGSFDWYSARQVCYSMEGDLMTLGNRGLSDRVSSIISSNAQVPDEAYWVGLYRRMFYWADETSWTLLKYANFGDGEPDLSKGECLTLNGDDGKWYATNCDNSLYYICQFETFQSDLPPEETTTYDLPETTAVSGTLEPGSAGASTNESSDDWNIIYIVLICIVCFLVLAAIIFAVLFARYKMKSRGSGAGYVAGGHKVAPVEKVRAYDARGSAANPGTGDIYADPFDGYSDSNSGNFLVYNNY